MKTNFIPIVRAHIMNTRLETGAVQNINNYIDNYIDNCEQLKKDYSHNLAGQIKLGEQVKLNINDPELLDLKLTLNNMSKEYIKYWIDNTQVGHNAMKRNTNNIFSKMPRIEVNDIWYNKYYEGDYNPLHNHQTPSRMGLSCFLFLKLPKHQKNEIIDKEKSFSKNTVLDGTSYFNCSPATGHEVYDLVASSQMSIRPEIGAIWLFPKWLEHGVYPFRGLGERRTIAANINIWTNDQ